MTDLEALKAEAGAEAVDRVVRPGMRLGLGSGLDRGEDASNTTS